MARREWLGLRDAAQLTRRIVGCTLGEARAILIIARAVGARARDCGNRDWQEINDEWWLIDSSGIGWPNAKMNAAELREWLVRSRDELRTDYGIASPAIADPSKRLISPAGHLATETVSPSDIRTTTDEKVEAACGDWIRKLPERPDNKNTAFEEAKFAVVQIGILSRKAFDRQWADKAPAEWKRAGRRKR